MSKEKGDIYVEEEIIQGIRLGDNLAIKKIYQLYYPSVAHMIMNNHGSYDEAQDIFQESVLVLYDKVLHQDFVLSSKLKTFLYAVARRLWLKQLTRRGARYQTEDISLFQDTLIAEEAIEDHQTKENHFAQMEEALHQMGEPCRTILQDFYILNKSMQEICDKFGYTNTDNAKTQKYKCLQRLKKLFFTNKE